MYRIIKKAFSITAAERPFLFCLEYFFTLCDAILLALSAEFINNFFANLLDISKNDAIFPILTSLLLFGLIKIADEIADGLSNFLGEYYGELAAKKAMNILNEKTQKLDSSLFENTSFLDGQLKAFNGVDDVRSIVNTIMDIFTLYLPYFIVMFIWLYKLNGLLCFIIPLIFFPILISHIIRSKYYIEYEDDTATYRRKLAHYKDCLTSRNFFKETRCFGAENFFLNKYKETLLCLQNLKLKTEIKSNKIKIIAHSFTFLGIGGILVLLIVLTLTGKIHAAAFAAVLYSLSDLYSFMEEIFDFRFGDLVESAGKIKNYFAYLDLPEKEKSGSICIRDIETIRFENVSFSYPSSKINALKNINMCINRNETLAIVGENGSGKTTFAKLLLGLYKPTCGTIKINGFDINLINKENLMSHFSAVFQEHCNYKLTVKDNVAISNFEFLKTKNVDEKINSLLHQCDFSINVIKNKKNILDVKLGKEFDGLDLSGGQWQRLSTARCVFKNAPFFVLDEPTASIDPSEETKMLKQFLSFTKLKTCIIISHRAGLCKFADKVLVFKDGEIVGEGSHSYLMQTNAYYKNLYNCQAEFY